MMQHPPSTMPSIDPPAAPLYLHDLADLLHAHILTHTTGSHYDHLRALYNASFGDLHIAHPRTVAQPTHAQHLFQAVITLTPSLLQNLCCPENTAIEIAPRVALLTLLYVTQPIPQQHIRVTHTALRQLSHHATKSCEAAQLLNYLFSVRAFRVVPCLRHAPAHAPDDLVAAPRPELLALWKPSLMYGYQVALHSALDALKRQFNPLCPAARHHLKSAKEEVS